MVPSQVRGVVAANPALWLLLTNGRCVGPNRPHGVVTTIVDSVIALNQPRALRAEAPLWYFEGASYDENGTKYGNTWVLRPRLWFSVPRPPRKSISQVLSR